MIELKDELNAAPTDAWKRIPIMQNHHKWLLLCGRGDDGGFRFIFVSPQRRRYFFWIDIDTGRVTAAEVSAKSGVTVASYCDSLGDKPARMDDVLRLTPKHIIDKLHMLLDAIGGKAYDTHAATIWVARKYTEA